MYTLQDALNECNNNETQSTDVEHEFLFNYSKSAQDGCFLEIGSAQGGSIPCLIHGGGDGRKIYSIDPYYINNSEYGYDKDTLAMWKQSFADKILKNYPNVTQFNEQVEHAIFKIFDPISFVFIDGCHDYKYVYKDFWLVFHKVISGGIIACHDQGDATQQAGIPGYEGVKQFVKEVYTDKYFSEIGSVEKIIWGRKK